MSDERVQRTHFIGDDCPGAHRACPTCGSKKREVRRDVFSVDRYGDVYLPCDNEAFHGQPKSSGGGHYSPYSIETTNQTDPVKAAHEAVEHLDDAHGCSMSLCIERDAAHAALDAAVQDAVKGMHAQGCGCHSLNGTETHERMAWSHSQHPHPFADPRCLAARKEATRGKL